MLRRITLAVGAAAWLLGSAAFAADVKITGMHNCCGQCKANITKILTEAGATAIDIKPEGVAFTSDAPDKVVIALYDAGYSGKVEGAKTPEPKGVAGVKGKEFKVEGVHLCCGMCCRAVVAALKDVGTCAPKPRDASFTVTTTAETEAAAVVKALRAAGFNARIAK
jgi:hypothetical protein